MSGPALEAFLARLYTDAAFLDLFLRDPHQALAGAGLSPEEEAGVGALDRSRLLLAAGSFAGKRSQRGWRAGRRWWRSASSGSAHLEVILRRWLHGSPSPRWRRT